ncbi:hypothetical protein [Nocardioides daejeonensis]|uniref:hypothetical protein n=1 Tax=Nocardioides daejeonensis TaxID=1046556 RepID=UPI000D75025B|nr:hypothetical protein [Nocardioides daejeonensis]
MAPDSVVDHQLNLVTQDVLTWGSWGLTFVVLGVAIQMGRRERTPFYVLMVFAAGLGAFAEPIYDILMALHFYSTDGMFTHYTSFDVAQPVWTHSGYVVLYASAAMGISRLMSKGMLTRNKLFAFAGIEVVMSCVFEIYGTSMDGYTYWGPHVFRIFEYPIVCGVLEAAQVITFALAAAVLRKHATQTWHLLGLLVVFPCTFFLVNVGAGWPTMVGLHLEDTSRTIVTIGTLMSFGLAAAVVRLAGAMLPYAVLTPAPVPASTESEPREERTLV